MLLEQKHQLFLIPNEECLYFALNIFLSSVSTPVRTLFEPHPEGVVALGMTPDAKYLATISAERTQVGEDL